MKITDASLNSLTKNLSNLKNLKKLNLNLMQWGCKNETITEKSFENLIKTLINFK